jgi:outer membrane protein
VPRALHVLLVLVLGGTALPPAYAAEDLLSLYRHAQSDNPLLRARALAVERARADADVAQSRLLPQVSLQTTASRNRYEDAFGMSGFHGQRLILSARQALLDRASMFRHGGAQAAIHQSAQELEQARAEIFSQLADQYLQTLQAYDELTQLLAERAAADRQVQRLRAMREREMAKVTDLAEAIAWASQLLTREIDARNKADGARVRLRELVGRDPGELKTLARSSFPPVPGSEQYWVEQTATANALIGARRAAVEIGRLGTRAAEAEHWPTLNLLLQRNQSNQDIDNAPRRDFTVDLVALELRIPLYEGGRVAAATASASAQMAIANEQLEAARREIERETRLLYASAVANRARIDSTDAEVDALAQTVRAQERGYELGVVTVIHVLDARRRLLRSRTEQARARYDYLRDLIGLRLRAGNFTEQAVVGFNAWLAVRDGRGELLADMFEQLSRQ